MRTLHTYGDSHATRYGAWDKINIDGLKININHLGGKLMYSFGRDMLKVVSNINDGDIICFCFGEIDCRCHINKYEPNWEKNIDDVVENYFICIQKNVENFKNVKVFIYNVVPQLERELEYNKWTEIGAELPAMGTDKDRKKYTLYMNDKLREYCEKYDYVFLDVYNKYINEKGFLNEKLSDTNCHIKDPIYVKEFIVNYLNKTI